MPQITAYVLPTEKAAFDAYAAEIGIDVSGLVKLLIVRERQLVRSGHSSQSGVRAVGSRRRRGRTEPLDKITAHVPSKEWVERFDDYAASRGLKRDAAAASLIRRELEQRWLYRAVSNIES